MGDHTCPAHGIHPHSGMTCLDCSTCRPPTWAGLEECKGNPVPFESPAEIVSLLRWLHAEAAFERDTTLANFEAALADKDRVIQRMAVWRDRWMDAWHATHAEWWKSQGEFCGNHLMSPVDGCHNGTCPRCWDQWEADQAEGPEGDPTWRAVGGDPLSGTPWAEGGEPA